MSELTEWLRKESNRNARMQGDKIHTNQRRKVFRRRNHMLMDAANKIESFEAKTQWQPIETAPKNKTLLLGFHNSHGNWRTLRGQWFFQEEIDEWWDEDCGGKEGWYETAVEPDVPNCWNTSPTHWMPLPEPPEQES